jgi:succinate dehydrogenase/fumarate reductase cytochrome b subunit
MSKKLLGLFLLGLFLIGSVGSIAFAKATPPEPEKLPEFTAEEVLAIPPRLANWLFTILLIVVVIMIIVAAYIFVTAAGNPDRVAKARNLLMYALIGLGVAMIARGIIALVAVLLGEKVPKYPVGG